MLQKEILPEGINKVQFILKGQKYPVTINYTKPDYLLSFTYNPVLIDEVKESTEKRQWVPESKEWRLKKSPRNDFVLSYLMGKNPYGRYDINIVGDNVPAVPMHPNTELFWDHQMQMYMHQMIRRRCIVAGETRTGKTLPTFTTILANAIKESWWIAPKSALKGLGIELWKWKVDTNQNNILLLTYNAFRDTVADWSDHKLLNFVPRFIVFDEAHKLKNPSSKQGRLARHVSQMQKEKYGDDCFMVLLSGTPAPLKPSDWWNLTEICQPGFLREGSEVALKNRLGDFEQREGQHDQKYWHLLGWKKDEVEYLHKRLSGMVEVYLRKDCLNLPQKIRNNIDLKPTKDYVKAARMAQKIEKSAAVLRQKLRQISDGIMYINEIDIVTAKSKRVETKFFPSCPKDSQLINDLAEFEDVGRVIVYCAFQGTIDKLAKIIIREGWAVLKVDGRNWEALNTELSYEECLKEMDGSFFNKSLKQGDVTQKRLPKLCFLANQGAASTGLELSASPVIINYSQCNNGADADQAEGRAYSNNMDKVKGLEIRNYFHLSVDKLVNDNLLNKKTLQSITMGELSATVNQDEARVV